MRVGMKKADAAEPWRRETRRGEATPRSGEGHNKARAWSRVGSSPTLSWHSVTAFARRRQHRMESALTLGSAKRDSEDSSCREQKGAAKKEPATQRLGKAHARTALGVDGGTDAQLLCVVYGATVRGPTLRFSSARLS